MRFVLAIVALLATDCTPSPVSPSRPSVTSPAGVSGMRAEEPSTWPFLSLPDGSVSSADGGDDNGGNFGGDGLRPVLQ